MILKNPEATRPTYTFHYIPGSTEKQDNNQGSINL